VTIACPESLIPSANQFALAIGESRDDDRTFGQASYQDTQGNAYAVASTLAVAAFPDIAASDLEAEAIKRFGYDHPVNLALAQQAQQALAIGATAAPDHIAVSLLDDPAAAIAALGLSTWSPSDEAEI
jgi:hypothetical protein